TYWKPTIYVSGFTRVANYSNILMMSEWMYEKPSDFAENWLMVPCPKGTRMLVVAYKGITKCFNKFGNFRFECRTALPGGNPCQIKSNKCTVVLDCFYHKESNTMHVLDILAWNDCVMTECEAGFRHFWMTGHLEQIPELQ
ncbi:putative Snurportin-1, partial [Operophtera brumata]